VKAARAAGKIMRDHWHLPKRVNSAEAHDIKLELDVRCQKLIEKILRAGSVPHVFVSGDVVSVRAVRPDAIVLQKPFRDQDLARAIQRALSASNC